MTLEIRTISFGGMTGNCYLLKAGTGFILIDTAGASKRTRLERELESAGCAPGNLRLIVLTHGDFDHTGNCAFLRDRFGAKIAMHRDDSGMVERGDMFLNRKRGNRLIKKIINAFFGITKFKPDFTVDEGDDLSEYGLDARVVHIPGHSMGSIGILTTEGALFCGDIFTNIDRPVPNSMADDPAVLKASVDRLKGFRIITVYPGHGKPFKMSSLVK